VNDVGGACVYGSNYPPVGEYISDIEISFTGTPVYEISLTHPDKGSAAVKSGDTFLLPCDYTLTSFTDATGAPGIMKCIPMIGSIGFSVPSNISKGIAASFVVNNEPTAPNSAAVTYRWTASNFSPTTYEGRTFTTTALATPGTYSVRLTAQSEGYCDLAITKDVTVADCHAPGSTVNFTAFAPCDAATGTVWYLTDTRTYGNNKTYKVKKMADGHIWMVQDLMFGNCTDASFKNDNSEAATTVTPTVAPGYVGHCRTIPVTGAGFYYNWPAVMNNKLAYYGSTYTALQCTGVGAGTVSPNPGACRGICPDGWHIPTGNTNGEFAALHNATGNCSTSNDNCWNSTSAFEGICYTGYCTQAGSPSNVGYTEYCTSTYRGSSNMYDLKFSLSSVYIGTYSDAVKSDGYAVRCIKNY
jgi:uncharacterized protein (TIGR02145 family)